MYWLILIICFLVIPVLLGVIAYYKNMERYYALMKWRRAITSDGYLIAVGITYIILMLLLAFLKATAGHDIRLMAIYTTIAAFLSVLIWLKLEYQVSLWIKNYWKLISIVLAAIYLFMSAYAQVMIDTIIVDLTSYNASEFPTAQLSLFLVVMPVIIYLMSTVFIVAITLILELSIFMSIIKMVIRNNKTAYSIYRYVTNTRLKRQSEVNIGLNMLAKAITIFVLSVSVNMMIKVAPEYLESEDFEQFIKTTLIESSFLSAPTSCSNLQDVEGVKIAILAKDRVSIFKDGAEPEFSKAKCEYYTSPLLKVASKS